MSQDSHITPAAVITRQTVIIQSALLDLKNQDPQVWGDMCTAIVPVLHSISEVVSVGMAVPPIYIATVMEFEGLKAKLAAGQWPAWDFIKNPTDAIKSHPWYEFSRAPPPVPEGLCLDIPTFVTSARDREDLMKGKKGKHRVTQEELDEDFARDLATQLGIDEDVEWREDDSRVDSAKGKQTSLDNYYGIKKEWVESNAWLAPNATLIPAAVDTAESPLVTNPPQSCTPPSKPCMPRTTPDTDADDSRCNNCMRCNLECTPFTKAGRPAVQDAIAANDTEKPALQQGCSRRPASPSPARHCSPSHFKPTTAEKHWRSPMPIASSSEAGPAVGLQARPRKRPSPNVYVQVPVRRSAPFVVPPSATVLSGLICELLWEIANLRGTVDSQGQSMEALCQRVTTLPLVSLLLPPSPSPPALPCVHICYADSNHPPTPPAAPPSIPSASPLPKPPALPAPSNVGNAAVSSHRTHSQSPPPLSLATSNIAGHATLVDLTPPSIADGYPSPMVAVVVNDLCHLFDKVEHGEGDGVVPMDTSESEASVEVE
ncbi:hypothetical protein JVU11DRAFT_10064 [Chiua virens]|nr:hypothetical protein JVU11DRAFT_10064 [Chiua virens]